MRLVTTLTLWTAFLLQPLAIAAQEAKSKGGDSLPNRIAGSAAAEGLNAFSDGVKVSANKFSWWPMVIQFAMVFGGGIAAGDAFHSLHDLVTGDVRFMPIKAGPRALILIGLLGAGVSLAGFLLLRESSGEAVRVDAIGPATAAKTHLRVGDRILSVNEQRVWTPEQLKIVLKKSEGQPVDIRVVRPGTLWRIDYRLPSFDPGWIVGGSSQPGITSVLERKLVAVP